MVVAQQRSSDWILVVYGHPYDFDYQTNHPSEKAWVNRKEFKPSEINKAAKFIKDVLQGKIEIPLTTNKETAKV